MGKLYVVATPIGNLKDMSQRAVETLKSVNFIAAEDTRHTIKLLNYFNIKCKMVSYHKFNEKERSDDIISKMKNEDIDVALVSDAGTPCISDPGCYLVRQAREAGIEVIGISGPSAAITALSVSGFDTDNFTFIGFLPRDKSDRNRIYENINNSFVDIFVLYESPKRIIDLLSELKEEFPGSKVCVCSDLTKLYEKSYYGKTVDIYSELKQNEKSGLGEYTVILNKLSLGENEINDDKAISCESEMSIEAMLINIIIKNHCTLKEAIENLNKKMNSCSKKEIYKASLNLKEIMKSILS